MARRRYFRDTGPVQRTRVNHMIRLSPVRVIGPDNEQIGVIETSEALRMAEEHGLDLVEIVPTERPPVCRIMDYGKYKYDLSKKQQKNRASAKQSELKEIRLGRSVKIDPHDVKIRVDQARRFLMAGHKVQITQRFRGREMAHKELGLERLSEIVEDLSDIAKVDMAPKWMGRQASIVLSPDRTKVESVKRKLEKEKGQKDAPPAEEEPLPEPEDTEEDEHEESADTSAESPQEESAHESHEEADQEQVSSGSGNTDSDRRNQS